MRLKQLYHMKMTLRYNKKLSKNIREFVEDGYYLPPIEGKDILSFLENLNEDIENQIRLFRKGISTSWNDILYRLNILEPYLTEMKNNYKEKEQ